MRSKLLITALMTSTILATTCIDQSQAGLPLPPPPPPLPGVNVNINAFLPPPPGVHVRVDAGRPYYVEHGRRVYLKKKPKKNKHWDNGRKRGHYKH